MIAHPPRPATQITPAGTTPRRQFLSKVEKLYRSMQGKSTLGDLLPSFRPESRYLGYPQQSRRPPLPHRVHHVDFSHPDMYRQRHAWRDDPHRLTRT